MDNALLHVELTFTTYHFNCYLKMSDNKKKIKDEILELVQHGQYILYNEALKEGKVSQEDADRLRAREGYKKFMKDFSNIRFVYNKWYSKAIQVVGQVLIDRIAEFKRLYSDDKRTTKDITFLNYSISDYLIGLRITKGLDRNAVDAFSAFYSKMEQQISIISSCSDIIDSKIADIEGVLQAELFSSELEMSRDMLKKNYTRVAGALAGVTLEIHLKKVCKNHNVTFRKSHPTITDFNEELRRVELIDVPTWRLIQRLGDIRNMSVHSKEREPTADEIEDLIRGCEKLIAELF